MKAEFGFTLLELLSVLVLISLLTLLAAPHFKPLLEKTRSTTILENLINALAFARISAITHNSVVTICPNQDGNKCGHAWNRGWIIFLDPRASGQIENSSQILRIQNTLPPQDKLSLKASRSTSFFQFDPDGTTHGQDGTFIYESGTNTPRIMGQIKMSSTGKTQLIVSE